MVSLRETARRLTTRATHRVASLPILALQVHTACNCRCVMCDIWTANASGRELTGDELEGHLASIRRLHVQRVMLTGGEPLLHRNLWNLCLRLRDMGCRVTLVTTGLLLDKHVQDVATHVDQLVVSIDGPADVHDRIRRVSNGFSRIARGLDLLGNHATRPKTTARCVVQRLNFTRLVQTVQATREIGLDRVSFLAADVSSTAFNRSQPWDARRRSEIAISQDQLPLLAASITEVANRCQRELREGYIAGGINGLWRIHDYCRALVDDAPFPAVRCNAPWISAVLEPGGTVRPCFFHQPYDHASASLEATLNSKEAVWFRKHLDVRTDETCRRCVCTITKSPWSDV
jgi:MoaA/NifB/PqqE/SkfB family radical SAM enzyme